MSDDGNDKVVTLRPAKQMSLREALMASLNEDKENQSEYFEEVYARLLRAQADIASAIAGQCSDRRLNKLQDIEGEAVWEVIRARGVYRWQIGAKLKLLEVLMHQGQNWFDQREFFLLASAVMDLQHPEPLHRAPRALAEHGA
jgi:hypothetical protein